MTGVFGEAVRNCLYKFHFSKSQLLNWLFLFLREPVAHLLSHIFHLDYETIPI